MSNLKFAKTHNLVAFLEKPEESDGFEGIIDFLNASSIRYALTIHALVDGKKVIITEMSVRRVLQLKDTKEPITDEAANDEHVPTHSNDQLLSGEDRLKLNELMELYTNLLRKVGRTASIESSEDEVLGAQEDASKQGRKIADLDADTEHSQLKNKSFEEIQMLFDNTMKWVDSFVPMDSEVMEGSKSQAKGSKKRTREELKSDNSKKQKIDEKLEAEVDDEAEMKKHMEIVPDDEVAINAIPLATKSPIIVDWKIIKEGKMEYFQIIKADGSSMRPEEAYERVLWGDLKVMFEHDVESEVWRNLQGYNVTVWKLFSSNRVHFVRFQNLHIFMLVKQKYPLTPATITKMLNKKLQTEHWNEICYQLLKLMTKQCKNPGSV
ncbi:hypothetical protein Tco_1373138 [Tanacetum coccineum]